MKQLDIFDTDYESCNYTDTSQQALATIKPKIKTKRQVKINKFSSLKLENRISCFIKFLSTFKIIKYIWPVQK